VQEYGPSALGRSDDVTVATAFASCADASSDAALLRPVQSQLARLRNRLAGLEDRWDGPD